MFTRPQRNDPMLPPDAGGTGFAHVDVLFALEWSALAPGFGGWTVLVDNEAHPRLLSVVPPGSDTLAFFLFPSGGAVEVLWRSPHGGGTVLTVGRYAGLRTALLALCPLDERQMLRLDASMDALCPRAG
jgi:hypothetical protein